MRTSILSLLLISLVPIACELVTSVNFDSDNPDAVYVKSGDIIEVDIQFNQTITIFSGDIHGEDQIHVDDPGDACLTSDRVTHPCRCQGSGCSCSLNIPLDPTKNIQLIQIEMAATDLDDVIDWANITLSNGLWVPCGGGSFCSGGNVTCGPSEDLKNIGFHGETSLSGIIYTSETMTTLCVSDNGYHFEAFVHIDTCSEIDDMMTLFVEVTDEMMEGMVEMNLDFTNSDMQTGSITNSTDGSYLIVDHTPPEVTFLTVSSSNAMDSTLAVPGDIVTYNFTVNEELRITGGNSVMLTDGSGTHFYSPLLKMVDWTVDGYSYEVTITASDGDDEGSDFELYVYDRAGHATLVTATTDDSSVLYIPSRFVEISTDLWDGAYEHGEIIFTFTSDDPLFEHSDLVYNTTLCQNADFQGAFPEWTLRCDANWGYTITIDIIDNANGTGGILFDTIGFPYDIHSAENKQDFLSTCICNSTIYEDCVCTIDHPINPDYVVSDAHLSLSVFFPSSSSGEVSIASSSDGYPVHSRCRTTCFSSGTCFSNEDVTDFIPYGNVAVVFNHYNDEDGEIVVTTEFHLEFTDMSGQCDNACAEGAICRASTTGPHCECPWWYNSTNPYAGGPACTMNECGEDDEDYVDDNGNSCEDYQFSGCTDQGLDLDGYHELLRHCPQTCDSCPDPDGRKFRLVDGSSEHNGIVQMYRNGVWMTVDAGFQGEEDSYGICQHLGYSHGWSFEYTNLHSDLREQWNGRTFIPFISCRGDFDNIGLCSSRCFDSAEYRGFDEQEPGGMYVFCANLDECVEDEGPTIEYDSRDGEGDHVLSRRIHVHRTTEGPIWNPLLSYYSGSSWAYSGVYGTSWLPQPTQSAQDFDAEDYASNDWWSGCYADNDYYDFEGCARILGATLSMINYETWEVFDVYFTVWDQSTGADVGYTMTRKLSCS